MTIKQCARCGMDFDAAPKSRRYCQPCKDESDAQKRRRRMNSESVYSKKKRPSKKKAVDMKADGSVSTVVGLWRMHLAKQDRSEGDIMGRIRDTAPGIIQDWIHYYYEGRTITADLEISVKSLLPTVKLFDHLSNLKSAIEGNTVLPTRDIYDTLTGRVAIHRLIPQRVVSFNYRRGKSLSVSIEFQSGVSYGTIFQGKSDEEACLTLNRLFFPEDRYKTPYGHLKRLAKPKTQLQDA